MKAKVFALVLLSGAALACGLTSCKKPVACFTVSVPWDSIHVNEPVTFNGFCSEHVDEYIWQIQSAFDSAGSYDATFTQTFTDTGLVNVDLTVVGGTNTDYATESFRVIP